ncbi:hypothetical protein L7F22_004453 [Adiantum nelumboides]|nr:hypothetical protein [Adiantum nelumboides]
MGSPPVPQPLSTPSPWDNYLLQELNKIQNELALLKASIAAKDEKIMQLEAQLQNSQENTAKKESQAGTNPAQQQVTNQVVHKVIAEMEEKEQIEGNKIIRIGGMQGHKLSQAPGLRPQVFEQCNINTTIRLNLNPNEVQTRKASNAGRVIYEDPMQFTIGMSFTTCFSFQLITTASYGLCGSEFSFFISDSKQAPTCIAARYLGLVNPNAKKNEPEVSHFLAIDLDTHDS